MSKRVLVSGASGFVGLPLITALAAQGWQVEAVARRVPRISIAGVSWHSVDLLNPNESAALLRFLKPSHLVHAAWYVEHGKFWTASINQAWQSASYDLVRYFFNYGGQRLIGIGSCAEYATHAGADAQPWPETRAIAPATPYGQAKAQLAAQLFAYAQAHPNAQIVWARLFHLFGPNEAAARLVPSIIQGLLNGQCAVCRSGELIRDFASTWLIADALTAILNSAIVGPLNVASGVAVAIATVAQQIAEMIGRPDLLRLASAPTPVVDSVPNMVADVTRLRSELGYRYASSLDADLRRLILLQQNTLASNVG